MIGKIFLPPWTCDNRNMVRNAKQQGKRYSLDSNEEYIGHIYDDTGRYKTYYLKAGVDNIARFICSSDRDKFLTSNNDSPVLNTIGKFLDLACLDETEQKALITLINKYQGENTEFVSK
ncbi:MAG: hypothetical protein IJN92_10050 [Lachnospiraceae bacterium]|nr:hypothetical protein [Lachnospiraceae bacterium]